MTEAKSPVGTLNQTDWRKIGKGAIIAITGALLTYGSQIVSSTDFGSYTLLVGALWSVLTNMGWKLLEGK